MRLDKYLALSRLIRQRSAAKWACEAGRVRLLGRAGKAGAEVRVGDEISIDLRDRFLSVRVLEIPCGNVTKERAKTLYEVLEERDASTH